MTSNPPARNQLPDPMLRTLTDWAAANTRLPSPARILLRHGHLSNDGRLAPAYLRGPSGRCYANSGAALLELVAQGTAVQYCEGYAYNALYGGVFEHAWLLLDGTQVWETTWPSAKHVTYFGLTFGPSDMLDLLDLSNKSRLFGDWDHGFRLLRSHRHCCASAT